MKSMDDLTEAVVAADSPEAMGAVYRAIAAVLADHGPVLNYELNYDGTEDRERSAYVEGQHDAWALFNSSAIEHERGNSGEAQ